MRRSLVWSIAALTVLSVSSLGTFGGGTASAATWGENYFPNLPVVTHEGKTVRFYDDLIKDKIVLISFIYASCPDLCSLTTARLAQVQERLGDRVGRDIFMYSITLDPEHDTPEVLKAFSEAFHIAPGWLFLTGKPEDIDLIRYKLGERSRSLAEHRHEAPLGNDRTGQWTKVSPYDDLDRIVETILEMDPAWRAQRKRGNKQNYDYANVAAARIGDQRGQGLFIKACAACHTIGQEDHVGPDLMGVTARRDRAWLTRFIMDADQMRAQKDPIALELDAKYKNVVMPYLGLSETDVADVLAYLEAQTKRLAARTEIAEPHHDNHDHQHDKEVTQ